MPPRLPSIPQHIKRFCQQSRPLVAPQQRCERPSSGLPDRKDGGSPTELATTAAVGGERHRLPRQMASICADICVEIRRLCLLNPGIHQLISTHYH